MLSILAYADPSNSPVADVLSQQRRNDVSEYVNRAILGNFFCREFSHIAEYFSQRGGAPLETLLRQAVVVRGAMLDAKIGSAAFMNLDGYH